jgi:FKBP-type peptidyl-prolyl cis-trans isomerase 2
MSQKNAIFIALAAVLIAAMAAGCTSSSPSVKTGDNVTIDYIINSSDGTLLQTSYVQVAKDLGIFDASWEYTPYRFKVGEQDAIVGVNEAVIGMKANETKTVAIPPEKAYGEYNRSRILPMNLTDLKAQNITPYVNLTLSTIYGYARIDAIDLVNNTAYLDFNRAHAGETLVYQITIRKVE